MKRYYQTLLLSLVIPLWTHGQSTPPATDGATFTLEQCIQYALENTVEVKNARVDEQISQARVKETVGIGLPQVDASVGITHNQKLARFYQTYDPTQPAFFDMSQIPGIEPGDVVAFQNFFQLKSSADAGLNINQLLFSSTYLVGLKAASTYKALATKTTEQTKITVVENVTKAYYAVLINNERVTLFDNNIARVDSLLKTTRALNENGFAEEIDVDRIQVTLNNLKSEKLKFLNLQSLSLGLLKFQMNYPMEQALQVTGDISSIEVKEDLFDDYQEGWEYKNRIEYKLLETQRDLQKLDIKNKYSAGMPSLAGFIGLGYSTQSPNIGGLFKTNSGIPETDVVGPDKWYPYSRFGITLSIPIFSGLQRTYQVQQAKLTLLKTENSFNSLRQSIDLSIQQNTTTFKNSIESLRSQEENMVLADKVARITKIKYEQGVGSNIEVIDAESSLREAQVNYYNALYDAIIAKVDLDKAFAKIDPAQYTTTTTNK
ncbi:MAG TPA: TolC family protein [Ohtaekwangia sp.]|nr:TolC family protein [Ohtaekwangia sp.]